MDDNDYLPNFSGERSEEDDIELTDAIEAVLNDSSKVYCGSEGICKLEVETEKDSIESANNLSDDDVEASSGGMKRDSNGINLSDSDIEAPTDRKQDVDDSQSK